MAVSGHAGGDGGHRGNLSRAAQLLGNDTDVDNATRTVDRLGDQRHRRHGGANANGTVTFTPNANFNGAASFTYTVSDGNGAAPPATVTVQRRRRSTMRR